MADYPVYLWIATPHTSGTRSEIVPTLREAGHSSGLHLTGGMSDECQVSGS